MMCASVTVRVVFSLLVAGAVLTLGACHTAWPYIGGAAGATVLGGQAPTNEIEQIYYLGVFDPQEQVPPAVYRVTVRGQGSFISRTKFASGWVPANLVDTLNESIGFNEQGEFGVQSKPGDVQPPPPPKPAPKSGDAKNDDSKNDDAKEGGGSKKDGDAKKDAGSKKDDTKKDNGTKKDDDSSQPLPGDRTGIGQALPTGRRMIMFGPEGFREAPREHRLVIVMGGNPQAFFGAIGDSLGEIRNMKIQAADVAGTQAILREKLRIESEHGRLTDLRADLARRAGR